MWRCQWSLCSLSVVALIVYNVFVNIWLLRPTSCPTQARQLEESMPSQSSSPVASALRLATQECTPCTTFPPNPVQDDPISEMDIRLGRWDARHVYRLFDFVIVGDEYADLSEVRKVCLATQSSIEKLYSLIELADHWSGPISLSIYAAGDELRLVRAFMLYVRECYPRAYNRLAVHMVITSERTPVMDPLPTELARIIMKCLAPKLFVSKLLTFRHRDTSKWRVKSVYPQNHLRNLARRNCQTSHVFLVDVDIVPSKGMAETLDKFIRGANKCNLCAFVIPTYELDEHVQFPMNKSDLVRLSKKGLAIPFHQKVFIYNQFASNFTRWEQSLGKESEDVHVSHTVTNFELLYEPFYVAPDTVPPHDERFLGYGFTRNTQVYEMFLMGYKFQVLSPIFTIHWGIQKRSARPLWREKQNEKNRRIFETFKRELFARYRKDPLKLLHKAPDKTKAQRGLN